MDCASTSWRLGAEDIYIVYRRGRDEMVVDEEELGETAREGMEFIYLASPVEVLTGTDGHVRGVRFVRNRLGEPDKSGRRAPEPIPGSEFEIACETVLLALGQAPDTTFLGEFSEFRVKRWRDVKVDADTYQTAVPKIFMAGDYRTGPTTIIEAVAEGRSAAQQIARFLDPIANAVNIPEYHEIVTLRRSSTPDNVGQIAGEGELARVDHNMSVDNDRIPRRGMPEIGKPLPREAIDGEIHLDLAIGSGRRMRPLPMYAPALAGGYKPITNGHPSGNGRNGHNGRPARDKEREAVH